MICRMKYMWKFLETFLLFEKKDFWEFQKIFYSM